MKTLTECFTMVDQFGNKTQHFTALVPRIGECIVVEERADADETERKERHFRVKDVRYTFNRLISPAEVLVEEEHNPEPWLG